MAEVQSLADTVFFRVLCHDTFLNGNRLRHHLIQECIIHLLVEVEQHNCRIGVHRTDQRMFNHFRIAG